MTNTPEPAGFLTAPAPDRAAEELFADDRTDLGFVMNLSRVWAYDVGALDGLFAVARRVAQGAELSIRCRLLIVLSTSAARHSSYCVYAWGAKFGDELDPLSAAAVIRGDDEPVGLSNAEAALVRWCRTVVTRPQTTTPDDVGTLRAAGWSDQEIFAITVFAASRLAFATVNDALGAQPDRQFAERTPADLRRAIDFGRPLGR